MAYSFEQVFAADPSNPANVARNAAVTIFAPGDIAQTPLTLTTPNGDPLANPLQVNNNGFGSAFMHATLDRVAWAGGNFTGFFTSYEGMKAEAVSARTAAQTAASTAGAEAAAVATAAIGTATDDAEAAATSAAAAATAAANSAALVGAPADAAIAAAINGVGTATKTALSATIDTKVSAAIEAIPPGSEVEDAEFATYFAQAVGSSRLATPYKVETVMPKPPTITFGGSGDLGGKTLISILREVRVTTVNGSADVTAVTGTFTAADVGKRVVSGSGALPSGANMTITAFTDATHVTLSAAATGSTTAGLVFSEPSANFRQISGLPLKGHSANGVAGTFAHITPDPTIYVTAQFAVGIRLTGISQFSVYSYSHITDPKKLRISVDRGFGFESVSADAITLTATSSSVLTTVNFGSVLPFATVRIEAHQDSPGVQGIYLLASEITAGATWAAEVPAKLPAMSLAVLADSYHETGSGGATGVKTAWDSPGAVAAKRLGFIDFQNRGQAGTGWLNEGKGVRATNFKARDRIANLAAINPDPDVLFIALGENDGGSTQQAVTDEVTYVLGQIATQLPFTRTFLFGAYGSLTLGGLATANAGIKAAAATAGVPFIDPLTGDIYNRAGALVHDGTPWLEAGDYTPDGIHVTPVASRKIGRLMADAYVKLEGIKR